MTSLKIDQRRYLQLMQNLSVLPKRIGLRVFRVALNAWGGVVKQAQKSSWKKRTGLLRRSPTVKVKIPDASYNVAHHGKPAYVIVGPGRDVVGPVTKINGKSRLLGIKRATKFVLGGGKVKTARASRYAHLVERGIAGTVRIAPNPAVAMSVAAGETAGFTKLTQKLEQGIAAEAAALPKG